MQAGRLAEAHQSLADLVSLDPNNAQFLGLQGIVALQAGDTNRAVTMLSESVAGHGPAAVMRRNIQALLKLAIGLRSEPLVERALERPVPVDDAKFRQRTEEREVIAVLVEQLALIGRRERALAVLEPFMPQFSDDPRFLELFGALKLAANEPEDALVSLKSALKNGEPTSRLLLSLGTAAARMGDRPAQTKATAEFVNRFPLYVSDHKASQTVTIGVATWANRLINTANIVAFHFPLNFMWQVYKRHQDRYRFVSVLFNSPLALQAMSNTPRPDVLFNALTISEVMQKLGAKDTISTRAEVWGRPIINHPEKVLKTDRLSAPELYAGLDNWLIPKIARHRKDDDPAGLADRIEAEFEYPVIVRGLIEQLGKNMWLVKTRAGLLEAIKDVRADPFFYAIQFHESQNEDGLFRKLRAAVAGDSIQIVRADYDTGWNVHGRGSTEKLDFYADRSDLIKREIEICRDADSYFGFPVMDALRALRSRNPLDVFGIDFDVMEDGRLLFFEANAAMYLFSNNHPEMPAHPPEAEDAFLALFNKYLEDLKGRHRQISPYA